MASTNVSAVLFAKDLNRVAAFYSEALQMQCSTRDEYHWALNCRGFDLIVHQIPKHLTDQIMMATPPVRREDGAIRLSFPVRDVDGCRLLAQAFGGQIDDSPPPWAAAEARVFLGFDPEGNVFKVTEIVE